MNAAGEVGLLDYLEVCWRRRWWVAAAVSLSVVVAVSVLATQPPRFEAKATLAVTPATFGQRVVLLVAWNILPGGTLRSGEEVRTESRDELLRVSVVAPSATEARDAVERVVVWIDGERRQPESPVPPWRRALAAPTLEARLAWRTQLSEIEARLPRLAPTAAPYWTARALALNERLEAAPATPQAGERAEVVQRSWPAALPVPWVRTVSSAAIGGLVIGVFGALIHEWWRLTLAARGVA